MDRWIDPACMAAWWIVVGSLAAAPNDGATNPPPASRNEVVVTASRVARDAMSEPRTVYRLESQAKTVQESRRTLPDTLSGLPSVLGQKTSYGQGSPFLRGFTGFRTLCLIDGVRLNNSTFREGPNQYWSTVDPLSISHEEVVMGPSSVLYGSDAIGGTLNAFSVAPPEYAGAPVWERHLYYRGATADRSSIGRVQIAGRVSEQFGFSGGISMKDFGDVEGGKDVGKQEHTGYQEQDYDARADYYLDKNASLTLAHQAVSQDDAWRTHKTIYGIDWKGLKAGDEKVHSFDQDRDLTYLKYRASELNGPVDGIECTVSRHAQSEDQYRVKTDDTSDRQGVDVDTWGASIQMESDTRFGEWVYGSEYAYDLVDSYARKYKADGKLKSAEIQGPVADDASYESVGVYVENRLLCFDDRLDVVPGARYTFARADADKVKDPISGDRMSIEGDWDAVASSLRLLHPLTADRTHVVFAGVSQGFRAPNLSDLTRLDSARSTEIETPVSDLDPEKYVAYEAGLKSRIRRLTAQVGYYYTTIDNMIVRAPTGRVVDELLEVTKKNSGHGYIQGVELSGSYEFTPSWVARANASWMDGKVDAYPASDAVMERDFISRLMPPSAEVALRWEKPDGRLWCEVAGLFADKADKLSADDERDTQRIPRGGTPGYAVASLRTGTRIMDRMDLAVAVENCFDQDYRIHGSGVNEPGRNVVLTVASTF